MSKFENGISSYVHATATVHVYFPVDEKGNADICCRQCPFFRRSSQSCALNGKVVQYPEKYVGADCMLEEQPE